MAAKGIDADVFPALREILGRVAEQLAVHADTPDNFYLNTKEARFKGKPLFFGAVQRKKNHVILHLFPLNVEPALVERLPCFNFTGVDEALFHELAALVETGLQAHRLRGWV